MSRLGRRQPDVLRELSVSAPYQAGPWGWTEQEHALWERSPDGQTWQPWMRISFTKIG